MAISSEALVQPRVAAGEPSAEAKADEATSARALRLERMAILGFGTAAFLGLAAVLVFRYQVYFGDALSRAYIAASIVLSEPPSLANLGFIWSPLPSIVQLPFVLIPPLLEHGFAPNVPTALFAAGSLALLNDLARPWLPERRYRFLVLAAYQLHPMILLYSINGMSEQLLIFFTLACMLLMQQLLLSEWTFRSYLKASATGFLAAAGFLTRYEGFVLGVVLAMAVAIAPVLLRRWRIPTEIEAALLSYSVPFTYAVFMWLFFNWTIMGNPIHFLVGPGSNREQAAALLQSNPFIASLFQNLSGSTAYVALLVAYTFPGAFLVGLGLLARLVLSRDAYALVLLLLLASVPLFQTAMHFLGQSFGYLRFHIYSIPVAVVGLVYLTWVLRRRLAPRLSLSLALLLMLGSGAVNALATFRDDYERFLEPRVAETVSLIEAHHEASLASRFDLPTFSQQRDIAAAVRDLPRPGRILADERYADHIIVFSGQFRRFLTSRDPLFRSAVQNPEKAQVDYILIPELPAGASTLNDERPQLFSQGASGLRLIADWQPGTAGRWRLYEVVSS
ncbi:MAG: hypothetical protein HY534_03455 [Chloroflexi bacterium]|nr:hypothetical protein [Chloroflexota bacterium]